MNARIILSVLTLVLLTSFTNAYEFGWIHGTVYGPGGAPAAGVTVIARPVGDPDGVAGLSETDSSGAFSILFLGYSGFCKVEFMDYSHIYRNEFYQDADDFYSAEMIYMADGVERMISAELAIIGHVGGTISGRVMEPGAGGNILLEGIEVTAYKLNGTTWEVAGSTVTDSIGSYSLANLPGNTNYRVGFVNYSFGFVPEYYDNAENISSATDVWVAEGGGASNIDALLVKGGAVTGKVTKPDGVTGIGGIKVLAYLLEDTTWRPRNELQTLSTGFYQFVGIPKGTYRFQFVDPSGTYSTEWYNNAINITEANDITVTGYMSVSDVSLQPAYNFTTWPALATLPISQRDPNSDPDSDGLANFLEYALDLNPNVSGGAFTGSPPELSTTPTLLQLTYRRVRNNVTYTVETSSTLTGSTWTTVGVSQGTPGPDGTTTASIPITPGSHFMRLSVTSTSPNPPSPP